MPAGAAADRNGNLFVADLGNQSGGGSGGLYEVPAAGGYTTVNLLGGGSFYAPSSVALDGNGNLFVADIGDGAGGHHAGVYEVLAAGGYTTVNPVASGAFYAPAGVAVDGNGDVFVADRGNGAGGSNAGVYEVSGSTVTQLAPSAMFEAPDSIAVDKSGNVFVADYGNGAGGNHAGFYEISGATMTQLAASEGFEAPSGIAVDANDNVFTSDEGKATINEVPASGNYSTVISLGSGFSGPMGLSLDWGENVYIANSGNGRVEELELAATNLGTVEVGSSSTVPVEVTFTFGGAVTLSSTSPFKVLTQGVPGLDFTATSGSTGNCSGSYDAGSSCTVSVTFTPQSSGIRYGAVTLYGSSGPIATANLFGKGIAPQLVFGRGAQSVVASGISGPGAVAVDAGGNIFVPSKGAGTVVKIASSGTTYSPPVAILSGLTSPTGVAVDGGGNIFVADSSLGIDEATQSQGTYAQSNVNTLGGLVGVAVDQYENLYVTDASNGSVYKETPANGSYVQATIGGGFTDPAGIVTDGNGNVFLTESGRGTVDELTPFNGSYSQVTVDSGLADPEGIAIDAAGSLYISSADTPLMYKETPTSNGGYSRSVIFTNISPQPWWATVDASGNLYFTANNSEASDGVYRIDAVDAPPLSFPTPTALGLPDSTDNPQTEILWNIGNASLTFPVPTANNSNPSFSAGSAFSLDSSSTCPNLTSNSAQGTEAPGGSCTYAVDFTPNISGANSGSLTLTDSNLNAKSASQSISLSGTAASAAATPTFKPAAGTYASVQSVTIADTTAGATIYYTTNGTTPTTSSTPYTSAISVSATETIKAIAVAAGYSQSATASAAYTLNLPAAATPTFSPVAGKYTSIQSVTIADKTAGATIYYTTNGTTPTTSSTVYSGPVSVTSSETLEAIAVASGYSQSAVASAAYTLNLPAAATPTFSPAAGKYTSIQSVTIADKTAGTTIYYTTDGTTPSSASTPYTSAISVSTTETIKAVAMATGYSKSATASAAYTINLPAAATPTFSPAAGKYTSIQSVTIADKTAGATIYYTTNGTAPTTASTPYTSAISVSATETIKAIAVAAGYSQSATASAAYTINLAAAATPTFKPAAGTYTSVQSVTIADTTAGATIYYTTNGTTPTTSSTPYTSAISVSATETIKAIAVAAGYSQSATASAAYTINLAPAATPMFTPPAGTYTSAQPVTIGDTTPGAVIYYTTNGTIPTTSSAVYGAPVTVASSETLEAIAVASGYAQSALGSAAYTINLPQAAMPTFTPPAGTYTSAQPVTIGDTTPGAVIYYTTNGTIPTTSSAVYSAPVTVASSETLEAIAVASGYSQSALGSAAYTINLPQAAMPTFTPPAGTYTSAQSVTITSSAALTSVNAQNSLTGWDTCILSACDPGGTGVPVSTSQTIGNASPSLSGASMLASVTADADDTNALWTFYGADCDSCTNFNVDYQVYPPTTAGLGALEYDQFQFSVSLNTEFMWGMQYCFLGAACPGGHSSWDIWNQLAGEWVDTGITTAPNLGAWNHIQVHNHRVAGDTSDCSGQPCMHYDTFILNGTLNNLNLTEPASTLPDGWSSGDGFQIQMDVATVSGSTTYSEYLDDATFSETPATLYYTTNGTTPSTSSAVYSAPVTVASSETLEAIAVASGYSQSALGSAAYTINLPQAAMPTFTPPAGTYTSAQPVTIGDTTPGAVIYYTTNGTIPTTSSAVYGAPVTVASSETLEAIAVASGYAQSALGSAAYTINLPQAAMPTFTPPAGTYTSEQPVTIGDTTPGAVIYYTTNGTTPSTSSAVYSAPVTVGSSETLEAIAVANGYSQSATGSAAYTIHGTGGTGTFTLRYATPASAACGTGSSCEVSLSGTPIVAGDLLAFQCNGLSNGMVIQSVSNTGTFVPVFAGFIGAPGGLQASEGYILSAAAEADTDTITFTGSSSQAQCMIFDYSYTGSPAFDGANGAVGADGAATLAVPAFTPSSGSNNDIYLESVSTPWAPASSIDSPFTIIPGYWASWAYEDNTTNAYGPTWTWSSPQSSPLTANEMEFGFNVTAPESLALNPMSGTDGDEATTDSVASTTYGVQTEWFENGSCAFTYSTAASAPLSGQTGRLTDGGNYTDTSTTGISMPSDCGFGFFSYGTGNAVLSSSVVTAGLNINSTLPATDGSMIDSFTIQGYQTQDFINAMLANEGSSRGVQMECGSTNNHGFYPLAVGSTYHFDEIYNPAIGTVNTSGTTVTLVSGNPFSSALLDGTAQIYIADTAYTVSAVNSPTSLTLTSSAGTQSGASYAASHYIKVYSGWSSPSSPGTLLTTIGCESLGVDPAMVTFGNNNTYVPTAGYVINFDTLLVSRDGQDPL